MVLFENALGCDFNPAPIEQKAIAPITTASLGGNVTSFGIGALLVYSIYRCFSHRSNKSVNHAEYKHHKKKIHSSSYEISFHANSTYWHARF